MRTWMWLAFALVLAGLYGCNSDAKRDAKRDQDRAAIELANAEREQDADKAQIDDLRTQLQDLQTKETAENDQNAKLTQEIEQLREQLAAKSASTEPAK